MLQKRDLVFETLPLYAGMTEVFVVCRSPSGQITRKVPQSSDVPGGGGSNPPRNSESPLKSCQTQPDCENCQKLLNLARQHPKMFEKKKGTKILKLPPVRNCFTLVMTNKLVVIINSLKVPKIKKILHEKKFLVPNYSCLQNL